MIDFGPCGKAKVKAQRIYCVNNLRQIGAARSTWFEDTAHSPLVTVDEGFFTKYDKGVTCWTNYLFMAKNKTAIPKVLVCPADERFPATNFLVKGSLEDHGNADFGANTNISYFAGGNFDPTYPQSILNGDRNLGPGLTPLQDYGFSPENNRGRVVILKTNTPVCWSLKMHSDRNPAGAGNILLADGSAQQCSSSRFRSDYLPDSCVSIESHATNSSAVAQAPSFRLFFP
jgi:hypothetical protein